jgi:small subunit ribosomal protein S14
VAKKSVINRQKKREKIVAKYAERRKELKSALRAMQLDPQRSVREYWDTQRKLQSLPRDSATVRLRRRCQLTGRGRGVYRMFGLSRSVLRLHAMRGELPGVMKSSW